MIFLDKIILSRIMESRLVEAGSSADSAFHVVASLIQTSERGVDSHGITLFPHYVQALQAGRVNGVPRMIFTRTSTSTGILNADHAFGHHAGAVAMEKAVELSKSSGLGAIAVRNSTHFGAAAYFALLATRSDCIGIAFTNADSLVKAHNAKEPFFGTNPICFAAPMDGEEPFCLDMATSMVSWNKIKQFRTSGEEIPAGWAYDESGEPTRDPHRARSLTPIGEYKGFGLGMMVDILCGLLAGGPSSREILPMYSSPIHEKRQISHFFMSIYVEKYTGIDLFRARLSDWARQIRKLTPIEPSQGVMIAGDPEKRSREERSKSGIPIEETAFQELLSLSPKFQDAVRRI